jgi:hypothetical protein
MTVKLFSAAPNSKSLALFKGWGHGLSDNLNAVALPKTTDTGQVDWANTATSPSGANQNTCYEVRGFADTLQSISPIFFKLVYGSGAGLGTPGLQLVVGTSTNGAGSIQGNTATFDIRGSSGDDGELRACVISGDKNRVACILFQNSYQPIFFSIERTKDINGVDTSEGTLVTVISHNGVNSSSVRRNQFIPATSNGLVVISSEDLGFFPPTGVASSSDGVNTSVYPNYFFRGGTILSPGLNTLAYLNNDFPQGSIVKIPRYNKTFSYYFIGATGTGLTDGGNFNRVGRGYIASTCLAMLYE